MTNNACLEWQKKNVYLVIYIFCDTHSNEVKMILYFYLELMLFALLININNLNRVLWKIYIFYVRHIMTDHINKMANQT